MKALCIDFGNTLGKCAIVTNGVVEDVYKFEYRNTVKNIKNYIKKYKPTHCIFCSVIAIDEKIILEIKSKCKIIFVDENIIYPFKNLYKSPETLGKDRLALVANASKQFPNENTLIISCGTCITYNFINHKNQFIGGAISPGLQMRVKAMNHYTQKLPLVNIKNKIELIGTNTTKSLQSGAVNGLRAELWGMIQAYQQQFDKINVVLTGGDITHLAVTLKNRIFADANFLFKGLYAILEYNIDKCV